MTKTTEIECSTIQDLRAALGLARKLFGASAVDVLVRGHVEDLRGDTIFADAGETRVKVGRGRPRVEADDEWCAVDPSTLRGVWVVRVRSGGYRYSR